MLGGKKDDSTANTLIFIGTIIVVILSGTAICNFFAISFEAWGPYLAWFIALGLFYLLLPKVASKIFTLEDAQKLEKIQS